MVRKGTKVTARVEIAEITLEGVHFVHARQGDKGQVIDCRPGYLPTVRWQGGTVYDCDPDTDFVETAPILPAPRGHHAAA